MYFAKTRHQEGMPHDASLSGGPLAYVKKAVMVTAYNGSWRSKNAGISEELDEVFDTFFLWNRREKRFYIHRKKKRPNPFGLKNLDPKEKQ